MGDRITSADFYNKKLYRDGDGPFPVPLADQPTRPLTDEERNDKFLQNIRDPQYQLFVRDTKHPVVSEAAKYKEAFKYLDIERYHPVPRQKWKFNPEDVKELVTLPNNRPLVDYVANMQDILKDLSAVDERHPAFKPGLELHRNAVRAALRGKALAPLANALEGMLHDRGIPNDPERPSMEEFWQQPDPEIGKLRGQVVRMRDAVQLGDPLVVTRAFGKGRTVAIMTTAGRKWNNWAAGGPASFTFPVITLEMQKYLSSICGGEASCPWRRAVRWMPSPERPEILPGRVEHRRYPPTPRPRTPQVRAEDYAWRWKDKEAPRAPEKKDGKGNDAPENVVERMRFEYTKARKPGIYFFQFTRRGVEAEGQPRIETRAFAFNVDTVNESDLRRISGAELEKIAEKVPVISPDSGTRSATGDVVPSDKQSDLSESGWLYLLFLVILIVEQALAVHLSFHLKGSEMTPAAPAAAATV